MTDEITVAEWSDIDATDDPSGRDKHRVAGLLNDGWPHVVWIAGWLLDEDDKDLTTVDASEHLAVGRVEDHSDKAWRLQQAHEGTGQSCYLPKSQTVVFEREGTGEIQTPQETLRGFER